MSDRRKKDGERAHIRVFRCTHGVDGLGAQGIQYAYGEKRRGGGGVVFFLHVLGVYFTITPQSLRSQVHPKLAALVRLVDCMSIINTVTKHPAREVGSGNYQTPFIFLHACPPAV